MDEQLARYVKLLCETMARGGDTNSLRANKNFAKLHRAALEALGHKQPSAFGIPVVEAPGAKGVTLVSGRRESHLSLVDSIFGHAKKSSEGEDGV